METHRTLPPPPSAPAPPPLDPARVILGFTLGAYLLGVLVSAVWMLTEAQNEYIVNATVYVIINAAVWTFLGLAFVILWFVLRRGGPLGKVLLVGVAVAGAVAGGAFTAVQLSPDPGGPEPLATGTEILSTELRAVTADIVPGGLEPLAEPDPCIDHLGRRSLFEQDVLVDLQGRGLTGPQAEQLAGRLRQRGWRIRSNEGPDQVGFIANRDEYSVNVLILTDGSDGARILGSTPCLTP
jgi:hypothetical protein